MLCVQSITTLPAPAARGISSAPRLARHYRRQRPARSAGRCRQRDWQRPPACGGRRRVKSRITCETAARFRRPPIAAGYLACGIRKILKVRARFPAGSIHAKHPCKRACKAQHIEFVRKDAGVQRLANTGKCFTVCRIAELP
ncbi:MAG: hypothetical protein Pg6A_15470 [Termitinemataceae bacterium]|nr:MAG: hypothetical protein Pg6A_15470 [Termitinemataceae bacterium]